MLLRGLKNHFFNITAIVTMTDDGASSGIIRQEFDTLPPGDIRKCISALAQDELQVSKVLEYRFPKGNKSFSGHTLGNIWITALANHFGSFEKAIETTLEIFSTRGIIYPATLDSIKLGAKFENGKKIIGESKITKTGKKIKEIFFTKNPKAYPKAIDAIKKADLIIIGPGSLFTSILPNLIIKKIANAIRNNRKALKIYIVNCSTEKGETEGFSVEEHIETLNELAGKGLFNHCLANNKIVSRSQNESRLGSIHNITTNKKEVGKVKIISRDVIDETNPLRHQSDKLARAIVEFYNSAKN